MNQECIFSVDVEEWWSVESFKKKISHLNTATFEDRIEKGINKVLDLLKKYDYKGAFFFLGRVAQKYPEIVKKIHSSGHEIGTHGFSHKVIYNLNASEFEDDLLNSIEIIENIIKEKVICYRAPSYSITKESIWALDILCKNGIKIDSSIVSTINQRFGIKDSPSHPYNIILPSGNAMIMEFPPSIINIFGYHLPVASGFAFRLFPSFIIKNVFKNNLTKYKYSQVILHNWEFDYDQPRIDPGLKGKLLHYYNLKSVERKLEYLFNTFKFIKLSDWKTNIPILHLKEIVTR